MYPMDDLRIPSLSEAIKEMILAYQDVNSSIDIYAQDPSIEVYARHIDRNRPFIVRGGCLDWTSKRWTVDYLLSKMEERSVKVAETPSGNADAVVIRPDDGIEYFVRPREKAEKFRDFMSFLQAVAINPSANRQSIKYSQAQHGQHPYTPENDNLHSEYLVLHEDVPEEIPKVSEILGSKPDAMNLWLGNSDSITSLHRDPYENIYAQVKGAKNFVLLPPVETACVNERFLPCAEYVAPPDWVIRPDSPRLEIPAPLWDPDRPEENTTEFSELSKPYRVRLGEGDLLYLPACWYHKVSQENSVEGICCSVNYWYDIDHTGSFYTADTYIRNTAWAATGEVSLRNKNARLGDELNQ